MKLYTERQMKEMFRMGLAHSTNEDGALEQFAHIELPSDEEIDEFINTFPYTKQLDDGQFNDGIIYGATIGIDWMRNKIQGGNNE